MSEVEIHENKKIEPASRTMETMPDLLEIIPLVTSASLLIEIATRVNGIVDAVEELADLAEFETASNEKSTKNELSNHFLPDQQKDNEATKDFQPVWSALLIQFILSKDCKKEMKGDTPPQIEASFS